MQDQDLRMAIVRSSLPLVCIMLRLLSMSLADLLPDWLLDGQGPVTEPMTTPHPPFITQLTRRPQTATGVNAAVSSHTNPGLCPFRDRSVMGWKFFSPGALASARRLHLLPRGCFCLPPECEPVHPIVFAACCSSVLLPVLQNPSSACLDAHPRCLDLPLVAHLPRLSCSP